MDTFRLCRGTVRDFYRVMGLIEAAARWLRDKDTDQWERPWPNRRARDARVMAGLVAGTTWIAWHRGKAVATITLDATANPIVWSPGEAAEPAAYVNRLVVDRDYAGRGLGAASLNWACKQAADSYGAELIRIDVWTTNEALHKYYERQGFTRVFPDCADPGYPSGARFERPTTYVGDLGAVELRVDLGRFARPTATMARYRERIPVLK